MATKNGRDKDIISYAVIPLPDGFRITHPKRNTVDVRVTDDHMWEIQWWGKSWNISRVPLLNFYSLISHVAAGAMHGWKSPVPYDEQKWYGVRDWVRNKVAQALNKRVYILWKDIIENRYETWQLALLRRVFSVTFRHLGENELKSLFDSHGLPGHDSYLLNDIMRYRAAAHGLVIRFKNVESTNEHTWENFEWHHMFGITMNTSRWKTLMNLPHPMSAQLLQFFRYLPPLDRPILTKRQLSWACAMAQIRSERRMPRRWSDYPQYTNDKDLGRAVNTYDRYLLGVGYVGFNAGTVATLSPNKCKSYTSLAGFVSDGFLIDPDYMRGCTTVNALVKRSIIVHREGRARRNTTYLAAHNYTLETETHKLPIELPPISGGTVMFLDTVGKVQAEGEKMGHCVSQYASYAVDGLSYLFHVTYKEEHATIEVSRDGYVRQAHGPHNTNNKAATWGQRVLSKWGSSFPNQRSGHGLKSFATLPLAGDW